MLWGILRMLNSDNLQLKWWQKSATKALKILCLPDTSVLTEKKKDMALYSQTHAQINQNFKASCQSKRLKSFHSSILNSCSRIWGFCVINRKKKWLADYESWALLTQARLMTSITFAFLQKNIKTNPKFHWKSCFTTHLHVVLPS